MSDAECTEDQQPLPKRQKLCSASGEEIEAADASVGARAGDIGEPPEINMSGSGSWKFLKEADVGITEYISSQPGFFAILKQRYSDFHVHEIAFNGETVRLTDFSPPSSDISVGDGGELGLADLFSSEDIDKLRRISRVTSSDVQQYVDIQAGCEKERRAAMHRAVKAHFPSLSSKTMEVAVEGEGEKETAGNKTIRVWPNNASPDRRNTRWPGGKNKYCQFTLYKENRDAVDVIGYLARQLGVKTHSFQAAGLKDRRAITTQHYTCFKVPAEKLLALNGSLKNVKIGNPSYVSSPLRLGHLAGNRFTIILRNVSCDDHVIHKKMTSLRDEGFINYFGMQRFGTSSIPTYSIGRCILHCDWKAAVETILMPRPGEAEDLTSARQYYMKTKDAEGTLRKLPPGRPLERALLQGLAKRKGLNDYLGALKCIPYSSRLMYMHSYQSLVWNRVVTHRIREYGLKPIPGDLVLENGNGPQVITEQTLPQYTMDDVVLPIPGCDVTLPDNEVRAVYQTLLAEDELTFQHLKHKVREFTLQGSYRHVIVKPKDMEWDILQYDDVTIPLALTDCDILSNKPPPQSVEEGQFKAIRMQFSLTPASYATMAVRELTKMETSSHYQTQFNTLSSQQSSSKQTLQ